MTKKKSADHAFELQQGLQQVDLADQQAKNRELLEAAEGAEAAGYTERRDHGNQVIGRIQMANGFAKLATVAVAADMAYLKDNKLYQGVTVTAQDGKPATVATWEDFCQLGLGMSRRTADDLVNNYKAFGHEALEAMQRAGIGTRRINELRRGVDDEERKLLINKIEVNAGDEEAIASLVEELVAEHAREKGALEKKGKDLEGDLEATRRVVEGKNQRITELETEAHKRNTMTPDEREADLRKRLQKTIEVASATYLEPHSVIKAIFDWDDAPDSLRHACAEGVTRLLIELEKLRLEYRLPITAPDLVAPLPELVE